MAKKQASYNCRKINHTGSLWNIFSRVELDSQEYEVNYHNQKHNPLVYKCRLGRRTIKIGLLTKLKNYPEIPHPIPYITPCVLAETKEKAQGLAKAIERETKRKYKELYSKF